MLKTENVGSTRIQQIAVTDVIREVLVVQTAVLVRIHRLGVDGGIHTRLIQVGIRRLDRVLHVGDVGRALLRVADSHAGRAVRGHRIRMLHFGVVLHGHRRGDRAADALHSQVVAVLVVAHHVRQFCRHVAATKPDTERIEGVSSITVDHREGHIIRLAVFGFADRILHFTGCIHSKLQEVGIADVQQAAVHTVVEQAAFLVRIATGAVARSDHTVLVGLLGIRNARNVDLADRIDGIGQIDLVTSLRIHRRFVDDEDIRAVAHRHVVLHSGRSDSRRRDRQQSHQQDDRCDQCQRLFTTCVLEHSLAPHSREFDTYKIIP